MVEKMLMCGSQWLSKFAVAMGGFLIFIGIIMVGLSALAFSGAVGLGVFERVLEDEGNRMLFLGVLLIIGVLDVVSGIILRHR
jgi:hypothetical protein